MSESLTPGSPESAANGDASTPQSKLHTSKDRQCQYCGQAFTSSSLGRHLDQFISKKKPDGIHDVDEIKKLRASITRRQPRTSQARSDGQDGDDTQGASPAPVRHELPVTVPFDERIPKQGRRYYLNAMTWQATGVINGLPEPGSTAKQPSPLPPPGILKRSSTTLDSPSKPDHADKDTIRALELALREVLETVQAASIKNAPQISPFTFDFQAQSYPSLCLRLLKPSTMLFSLQPLSTPNSIPIDPPGAQQLDAVREQIKNVIEAWQANVRLVKNACDFGTTQEELSDRILEIAQQHVEMTARHLELTYQHWVTLPDDVKQERWRLELLRAYAREVEQRKAKEEHLHQLEQEARRLKAQVDMLSRCQWPREFALFPPEHRPFSLNESREFQYNWTVKPSAVLEDSYWDYDKFLSRWKRVVSEDSARRMGMTSSSSSIRPPAASSSDIDSSSAEVIAEPQRPAPQPQPAGSYPRGRSPASKRPRLVHETTNGDQDASPDLNRHETDTVAHRPSEGIVDWSAGIRLPRNQPSFRAQSGK